MNRLGLIATIVPLVIVAIGLIGWVLTLRNDVTGSVQQLDGLHQTVDEIHQRIDGDVSSINERVDGDMDALRERIVELEERFALVDNEMRTIMADHAGFGDALRELGEPGALPTGERRTYGGYGN